MTSVELDQALVQLCGRIHADIGLNSANVTLVVATPLGSGISAGHVHHTDITQVAAIGGQAETLPAGEFTRAASRVHTVFSIRPYALNADGISSGATLR